MNHSQIQTEHFLNNDKYDNVDSFVVYLHVGAVIQAGEIQFFLLYLVDMFEYQ